MLLSSEILCIHTNRMHEVCCIVPSTPEHCSTQGSKPLIRIQMKDSARQALNFHFKVPPPHTHTHPNAFLLCPPLTVSLPQFVADRDGIAQHLRMILRKVYHTPTAIIAAVIILCAEPESIVLSDKATFPAIAGETTGRLSRDREGLWECA